MDVLLCSARDVSQGQTAVAALADAVQHHDLNPGQFIMITSCPGHCYLPAGRTRPIWA
jgi:chitinase